MRIEGRRGEYIGREERRDEQEVINKRREMKRDK